MLSLKKRGKPGDATHVCDIVHGRQRLVPVYYYHNIDDKLISKTDDYAALLQKSLPEIKDRLRVTRKRSFQRLHCCKAARNPPRTRRAKPGGRTTFSKNGQRSCCAKNLISETSQTRPKSTFRPISMCGQAQCSLLDQAAVAKGTLFAP